MHPIRKLLLCFFLFCVIDGSSFPNHCYADLPWIVHIRFDSFNDIFCQPYGCQIIDFLGFNHNPDFTAGLNGE